MNSGAWGRGADQRARRPGSRRRGIDGGRRDRLVRPPFRSLAPERSSRAARGAPEHAPKVLLAHQPRSATLAEAAGFQLALSGHTHGGQFWPWNFLVRLQQPFTAGLNRLGRLWVYTSRGTGYWGHRCGSGFLRRSRSSGWSGHNAYITVKYRRCSLARSLEERRATETDMEVHQTEFLHAVVLAGAVALGMTVWENSRKKRSCTPPARRRGRPARNPPASSNPISPWRRAGSKSSRKFRRRSLRDPHRPGAAVNAPDGS